jgi:ribosome-associated protein
MNGRELSQFAARLADEKKGSDIVIYDLRGVSDVTDYFVIATAQSRLQARAIAAGIEKTLKDQGVLKLGLEGGGDTQWILMDYGDAVIHVFSPQLRDYYSLESLWGDAPKVPWREGSAGEVPRPAPVGAPKSHKPFAHG